MEFSKVVKVRLKQLAWRYWASYFLDLPLQIIAFANSNDWMVVSDGTSTVKGMFLNRSIWFIFTDKTKWVPLTTRTHFLSLIAVHPSSHNVPKDVIDLLWISLNTFASHDFWVALKTLVFDLWNKNYWLCCLGDLQPYLSLVSCLFKLLCLHFKVLLWCFTIRFCKDGFNNKWY